MAIMLQLMYGHMYFVLTRTTGLLASTNSAVLLLSTNAHCL